MVSYRYYKASIGYLLKNLGSDKVSEWHLTDKSLIYTTNEIQVGGIISKRHIVPLSKVLEDE